MVYSHYKRIGFIVFYYRTMVLIPRLYNLKQRHPLECLDVFHATCASSGSLLVVIATLVSRMNSLSHLRYNTMLTTSSWLAARLILH